MYQLHNMRSMYFVFLASLKAHTHMQTMLGKEFIFLCLCLFLDGSFLHVIVCFICYATVRYTCNLMYLLHNKRPIGMYRIYFIFMKAWKHTWDSRMQTMLCEKWIGHAPQHRVSIRGTCPPSFSPLKMGWRLT